MNNLGRCSQPSHWHHLHPHLPFVSMRQLKAEPRALCRQLLAHSADHVLLFSSTCRLLAVQLGFGQLAVSSVMSRRRCERQALPWPGVHVQLAVASQAGGGVVVSLLLHDPSGIEDAPPEEFRAPLSPGAPASCGTGSAPCFGGSTHAILEACCYCCSCKLCMAPARGRHVRRHRKGRHPSKGQRHRPDRQARRVGFCTPSWGTGLGGGVSQFLTARHGDGTAVRQIRGPPAPSSPFSTAEGLHLCEGCQSILVPGRPRRPATCTPEP